MRYVYIKAVGEEQRQKVFVTYASNLISRSRAMNYPVWLIMCLNVSYKWVCSVNRLGRKERVTINALAALPHL